MYVLGEGFFEDLKESLLILCDGWEKLRRR